MTTFSQQVAAFNKKYEARVRATAREAVQETVSRAQRTRGEGGRMRIDTGFLRASIQAALGTMPSGPTNNPDDTKYSAGAQVAGEPVSVTLLKWDITRSQEIYVGWTANYARPREFKDGFLRGAVEQWDTIVGAAAKRVRQQLG